MTFDPTIASTCLARFSCKSHEVRCSSTCPLYNEIAYQTKLSGIPDEYVGKTIETLPPTWEFVFPKAMWDNEKKAMVDLDIRNVAKVFEKRKPNNGLFLSSEMSGNGKTSTACALAQSWIVARCLRAYRLGEPIGQLVTFVNTVELLDTIKAGFNDETMRAKADAMIRRIEKSEMVVLDDVGSERPSEFVAERFYSIIDGIWRRKSTQTLVATSNKTLDAIEITLGPRVRSRIDGLTITLRFQGGDRRRKSYQS